MSVEENKAIIRRWIDKAINKGSLAILDEIVAENYVYHGPGQEVRGPEGIKQLIASYRNAFPDMHWTIEDLIAEGDKVVTRATCTGTHKGELMGIKPMGKPITITAIVITRFEGGRAVEDWEEFDALGMMRQLGVTTLPPQV